jgi:hypothetical protein
MSMGFSEQELEGINLAIDEALLLDLALDLVLKSARITFEVFCISDKGEVPSDRRIVIHLKAISRISASLRHYDKNEKFIRTEKFDINNLEKIVKSFGGGGVYGTNFIRSGNDSLPAWAENVSLELSLGDDEGDYMIDLFQWNDSRKLDFRIWFNSLIIKKASNEEKISVDDFIAGGKRWWEAFNRNDPRTRGFGMFPLK